MRAAIYTRVSTEEQAREGYSLGAQEEAGRAYSKAQSWEVVGIYSDAGRSGKSIKGREALAQLMADAENGHLDRVIFWKLDRLGRNLRELLEISERLEAAGVGVVSIQEAFDTATPAGRMMRNVLGSLAVFEREVIIDRITTGMAQAARQGEIVGPLSLGYARSEAADIITTSDATLIREAFERYAVGQSSLSELAAWATAAGLRSTKGNAIDKLSVRKILTNPAYIGDVGYHRRAGGGTVASDAIPAIVSRELFDQVQRQLANRRRRAPVVPWGREPYPLTGVATCGRCGEGIVGNRNADYRYLRCSTAARMGQHACSQPMVQAGLVESQVGAYLEGFQTPDDDGVEMVMQRLRQLYEPTVHLDDETKRIEGQLARQRRLFVIGDVDELSYRRDTAPLRQRLSELQGRRQILDVERAMYHMRNISQLWEQSDRKVQREFVTEVFDRIVIDGAQITELQPKAVYAPFFVLDRAARFGGEMCSMAPRAGLGATLLHIYNPVINPRSKVPFWVPALAAAG